MQSIYYIRIKNQTITSIKKAKKIKKKFIEYNSYDSLVNNYEILKYFSFQKNFKMYVKDNRVSKSFYCSFISDYNYNLDNKNYYLLYQEELEKNEKLMKNINQEKNANNYKTIFLQSISHDIRTPMNAIMGFTDLALNYLDDKIKVEDYLTKISISSNHLLNLINNVLEMSKIESGNLNIDIKKCSLRELVYDIKNVFENLIKDKNIEFRIYVNNLINEDIYADILKLKQVFINLIGNSIKYILKNGKIDFIINQISHNIDVCEFEFIVKDNGMGMDKEFLSKAFAPFSRDANVNNIQGSGLGLSIVREIVNKMGGNIVVDSILGEGTVFTINLSFKVFETNLIKKLKDFEDVRILYLCDTSNINNIFYELSTVNIILEQISSGKIMKERIEQGLKYESTYDLCIIDENLYEYNISYLKEIKYNFKYLPIIIIKDNKKDCNYKYVDMIIEKPIMLSDFIVLFIKNEIREKKSILVSKKEKDKVILIVDDNELNREITKELLKIEGYKFEEASNGKEALDLIITKNKCFDLILMDIQMPIMDGFECVKNIRNKENLNMPIIAMTANAFDEQKNNILNNGFDNYISKPINFEKLINMIKGYTS